MHITDIYEMAGIAFNQPQTKQCLFCAETIQAAAVKCRFCGEFLDTGKAKALAVDLAPDSEPAGGGETGDNVLFAGRPSLWGMVGAGIKGLIFLAIAGFLIVYPLEKLSVFQPSENTELGGYNEWVEEPGEAETGTEVIGEQPKKFSKLTLTEEQALMFGRYRVIVGLGLAGLVVLVLLLKVIKLKMIYYEVTGDRIEWSRGIFDRRVDNMDMFRVIDLRLRRSLLDCIFGVGTVSLITTDKTDPEFIFEKIRNCRKLYDTIKRASLEADRRSGVVHLE